MSTESGALSTPGCKPRSRWILLAILSALAFGLWSLIGGWSAAEREIMQARACPSTCLERTQAYVEKTEVYTSSGDGQPGGGSTSYSAWLTVDGKLQKINNERPKVEKGGHPTVELLDGKVITVDGKMVWNGWPISKMAGLIFLLPLALLGTLGACTQALALLLHAMRVREATELSTFGTVVTGVITGELVMLVGYLIIDQMPWYWPLVGAAGGFTVTAICVSLVIAETPKPIQHS